MVDAVNATDNTAAHAHASPLAVAIALEAARHRADHAARLPRPEPARARRPTSSARRSTGSRTCSASQATTSPRATSPTRSRVFDLDSPQLLATASGARRGPLPSGRAIEPAAALFLGAVENPGAPPFEYRVDRAPKKHAPARASSSSRSASGRSCWRGSCTRPTGPAAQAAFCQRSASRARRGRSASWTRRCRGSTSRQRRSRASRRAADPRQTCLDLAAELAAARARAAGRGGPAPDQLPARRTASTALPPARHPDARGEGGEWRPSSGRRLGPSSSAPGGRSASSASASTRRAARRSRPQLQAGDLSQLEVDVPSRPPAARTCST